MVNQKFKEVQVKWAPFAVSRGCTDSYGGLQIGGLLLERDVIMLTCQI